MKSSFTFIDLFAGIGGMRLGFEAAGGSCQLTCEIDPYALKTYKLNYKKSDLDHIYVNDIFDLESSLVKKLKPDVLVAGFPCQPFSQAGHKRGFNEDRDSRGNMFFYVSDILQEKRPKAFFLENVRHLENHDDGRTFDTIKQILKNDLKYKIFYKVVKATDYGLPQHRPRIFIVGFREEDEYEGDFEFPEKKKLKFTMSDVWKGECSREIGFTLRVGGKGSGINDRRNWDAYLVDGEIRRLGVEEGKRMMGFPSTYKFPVSNVQAMKQLGNSVAVDAVQAVAKQIIAYLETAKN